MRTTFKQEPEHLIMSFEGRLDTAASSDVEEDMRVLYDCEGRDIILECSKLDYISSSGLRLFLGLIKVARPKGSRVFLSGMNEGLRQIFDETGFSTLFEIL